GVATFVRLVQVNNEDLYWVTGMNMLRGEYARLSPGVEKLFVSGHTLDVPGIARTFGAFDVTSDPSPWHALVTTPAIVGVISSAIAGVIAALRAFKVGLDHVVAIVVGVAVSLAAIVLSLGYGRREGRRYIVRAIEERIPNARAVDRDSSEGA